MKQSSEYGIADSTYLAAGGKQGIENLVLDFYQIMGSNPRYKPIFDMHPQNIELSLDKLALFLCGWMGGPRLFTEKYGQIAIPAAHQHLSIGEVERDLWLSCMSEALSKQDYPEALTLYLMQQFFIPAERVRLSSHSS